VSPLTRRAALTKPLRAIVPSQNKLGVRGNDYRSPELSRFRRGLIKDRLSQQFVKKDTAMVKDTIHDINSTTDYAANQGHSEIEDLRRQVKELTEKYGSMAQSKMQDVKDSVQQNIGDIEKQIRDKPVQATLVAAGVGFMIGALLSR
jgi:ElaB/YqjD/DUF883 family membrane-anchored ribosome-binding protein